MKVAAPVKSDVQKADDKKSVTLNVLYSAQLTKKEAVRKLKKIRSVMEACQKL